MFIFKLLSKLIICVSIINGDWVSKNIFSFNILSLPCKVIKLLSVANKLKLQNGIESSPPLISNCWQTVNESDKCFNQQVTNGQNDKTFMMQRYNGAPLVTFVIFTAGVVYLQFKSACVTKHCRATFQQASYKNKGENKN